MRIAYLRVLVRRTELHGKAQHLVVALRHHLVVMFARGGLREVAGLSQAASSGEPPRESLNFHMAAGCEVRRDVTYYEPSV